MKFISFSRKRFTFGLGPEEQEAFVTLLRFYPVAVGGRGAISKALNTETIAEAQKMLDEAVAEQIAESKKLVEAFVADPKRFKLQEDETYRMFLKEDEVEWLLQVLNNIRVGSWMELGSPEPGGELTLPPKEDSGRMVWSIYASDIFLGSLLYALEKQNSKTGADDEAK